MMMRVLQEAAHSWICKTLGCDTPPLLFGSNILPLICLCGGFFEFKTSLDHFKIK